VPTQNDSETELARRASGGDAAAFRDLYHRYRTRVHAFAYRMVRVQAIAEEITQEAFLVLIEHPERYQVDRGSMLTFLCAIARNKIMYHLRRNGHEFEIDDGRFTAAMKNHTEVKRDPLTDLLDRELAAEVNAAIATLPPLQREVIVLREFQELSYEEIATVTGVEINVIKVRLHRARQSLARRLTPHLVSLGDQCHELR
jgi:RNA polymerase sigma-70 factor (ECF subfamily)